MNLIKATSLFLVSVLFPFLLATSCQKNDLTDTSVTTVKTIKTLPEREAKVYVGIADRWHQMDDASNYSLWSYVRENAAGFYTNFIIMWKNSYQNTQDPQISCVNMRKAFLKNGCFFETSMETSVNSGSTGANDETTDKKYIDLLTNGGFNVDVTSLNYGVSEQRIKTLRTYNGNRSCLTLIGPWTIGGDIQSNAVTGNQKDRDNIAITDGMETDGPLGYWYNDTQYMCEGSYSLVKYVEDRKQISAVMLAPYAAGVSGYDQAKDYLTVSKQCVFGHEDKSASPDIWTIWTYGESGDEPTFPESVVNSLGETEAANTLTGVGYWVIKHLNNFPKLEITTTGSVMKATNDTTTEVSISRGSNGYAEDSLPIIISNDKDPQIEISPVIRATLDEGSKDWDISFSLAGKDVTDNVVYNGGLNCISKLRITKTNKLTLIMKIKSKNSYTSSTLPSLVNIKIETMSNISNTKNSKSYTVVVKPS
jgi:hypothetical protein